MNPTLENFGRETLKQLLNECSKEQFNLFKRMYCHKNINASIDEACELIRSDKIDWAVTQIENTLAKNID